ncbi:MAG: hypothetical protein HZB16_06940 [Armatimonadetes bacterium]|nr:hypothetical protein [Armatimonadota bacterium]
MSLRARLLRAMGLLLAVIVVVLAAAVQSVLVHGFRDLETKDAARNGERLREAYEREFDELRTSIKDYAAWDDTCTFIDDHNQEWVDSNLAMSTFGGKHWDALVVLDAAGQVVLAKGALPDAARESATDAPVPPELLKVLAANGPLARHTAIDSVVSGLLPTSQAPLMVVSLPVTNSNGEAPVRGSIVAARYLDEGQMEKLAKLTKLGVKLTPLPAKAYQGVSVAVVDGQTISASTLLTGLDGQPLTTLRATMPREVTAFGSRTVRAFAAIMLLLGIGLVALGLWAVRRIERLATTMVQGFARAAEETVAMAMQVADESHGMAAGAEQQTASLEAMSDVLRRLTSVTTQTAGHATEADGVADQAHAAALSGLGVMNQMIAAADGIKSASDETLPIVRTVDDLAFQTRILALNAAVEAARAGEAGEAFSVVAAEVRRLADHSAEAARETDSRLLSVGEQADRGAASARELNEVFGTIDNRAAQVKTAIGQVSAAALALAQAIGEAATGVAELDTVAKHNAGGAERTADASRQLLDGAEHLRAMLREVEIMVWGR